VFFRPPDAGTLKAIKNIAGGLLVSEKAVRYKATCRRKNGGYLRLQMKWVVRLYLYTHRTLPRVTRTAETALATFTLAVREPDAWSLNRSHMLLLIPGFP
jgi:hypothetical protein